MATVTAQKTLGAFYTDEAVARFLVRWAVRDGKDSILDPSCGCGVFLLAAAEHLRSMGNRRPDVWGIDIAPEALESVRARSSLPKVLNKDFFSLRPGDIPAFTAIVGNPPFIRYQTFNGSMRSAALRCAREAGVALPELSSSWAPFLVHAAGFLREGGRLGMVVPAELGHAQYAREVLRFLLRKFGRITVRMFQKKLFPDLSEDTMLLLCEDFGSRCGWFSVAPARSMEDIDQSEHSAVPVDIEAIRSGRLRLSHYLVSSKARHLYDSMLEQKGVTTLGEAGDVGIGYVTGCNDYFHLSATEAKEWHIPAGYLKRAVLSLANFRGNTLRETDWKEINQSAKKAYLLAIPPMGEDGLPRGLISYLNYGKQQGVPTRFKCRVREPWYSVSHVRVADAFLSYMSGDTPKLVANRANLVAPNTLHLIRFHKGWNPKPFITGWYCSLTRLSCELEGHALGGGLLKLEPTEAARVRVALPYPRDCSRLLQELDNLLRSGENETATDLADQRILRRRLGLSGAECATLHEAAMKIQAWRLHT